MSISLILTILELIIKIPEVAAVIKEIVEKLKKLGIGLRTGHLMAFEGIVTELHRQQCKDECHPAFIFDPKATLEAYARTL